MHEIRKEKDINGGGQSLLPCCTEMSQDLVIRTKHLTSTERTYCCLYETSQMSTTANRYKSESVNPMLTKN